MIYIFHACRVWSDMMDVRESGVAGNLAAWLLGRMLLCVVGVHWSVLRSCLSASVQYNWHQTGTTLASALSFTCLGQARKENKAFFMDNLLWKILHFLLKPLLCYVRNFPANFSESRFNICGGPTMCKPLCLRLQCPGMGIPLEIAYRLWEKGRGEESGGNSQGPESSAWTLGTGCSSRRACRASPLTCGRRVIPLPFWCCPWSKNLKSCSRFPLGTVWPWTSVLVDKGKMI